MSIDYAAIYRSEAAQVWKHQVQQLAAEKFGDPAFWEQADNHWLKAMYRAGHSPASTVLVYYTVTDDRQWYFAERDVVFSCRDLYSQKITRQQKRARSQVDRKHQACRQGFLSSQGDLTQYDPSVALLT